MNHVSGLVTLSNLFICFPSFYLIPKSIGAIDRPLVGAHADVLHNRFRAELYSFKHYPAPQEILCAGVHTRDDLCVRIHTADLDERRWTAAPQASGSVARAGKHVLCEKPIAGYAENGKKGR